MDIIDKAAQSGKDIFIRILTKDIIKIGILILALIYSFNLIFWGIDFADTFYWINIFPDYLKYPMSSGTLFIGDLWIKLFGNNLITVRILAWLIGISAVLLPFLALTPKKLWIKKSHYLALGLLLIRPFVFNADVTTLLFISITLVFTVKYYLSRKLLYIIFIGISSSVAVFIRFPNVLLFPLILFIIPLIEYLYHAPKNKSYLYKSFKMLLLFAIVYIVVFSIIAMVFYGNIKSFFSELQTSAAKLSLADETHTLRGMIQTIMNDMIKLVLYIGVLFLFDYILLIYKKCSIKNLRPFILLAGYALFVFFMFSEIIGSPYKWNFHLFISALFLFIILRFVSGIIENKDYKKVVLFLLIIIGAFITVAGSNTGLLKLSGLFLCFIPILLVELDLNLNKNFHLIPLISIFIFFVLFEYAHPYEDERFDRLTTTVSAEKQLKCVRTTPVRAEFISDLMKEYSKLDNKKNVVFFGRDSHVLYYLTRSTPLYQQSAGMRPYCKTDIENAQNQVLKTHPVFFYLTQYPEYYNENAEYTGVENMLFRNNYTLEKKKYYKIFSPNEKHPE